MKKNLAFLLLMAICSVINLHKAIAQENTDFMIWSGFTLTKNIAPNWSVRARQEIRFRENASQVQKAFADIGLRYKFNKHVRFTFHYRYNHNVRKDFEFSSRHRLNADMILRYKWKPVVVNYRLRYQQQFRDVFSSEDGFFPNHFIRHKLQGHLDLNKRWSPYASVELFHTIADFPTMLNVQNRARAGIAYEINRNNNITMYYMFRTKQNLSVPSTDHIIGFRLNVFI
jgi:outer membrane protein assembly factor BamA